MALQFGVGTVDNSDKTFEPRLDQATAKALIAAKLEKAPRHTGVVKLALVAVRPRGPHLHHFHLAVPVRRGGHGTPMGAKSDQACCASELISTKLTEVQLLPDDTHLREAGIADMRVVRPDHCLRLGTLRLEDMPQGLEHVGIAQIPRFGASVIHDPIVAFGGCDKTRVLRRVQEAVRVVRDGGSDHVRE